MIVKNAEPFYFPGNETGCLLIHGFTGAPTEMRPLGEYLAGQGYSVLGVRLAGHGTKIEDMNRVTWEDWSNSVLDGWNFLRPNTDRVFLIGLSMGGVLTLYHASFLPVAGLVSMSTIYQIDDARLKILPILSKFVKYIDKGKSDWQDEQAVEDHFSYDYYPTKALLQLAKLLEVMRNTIPNVTVPALLMHSRLDIGVPLANLEKIYRAIGTPENLKEKIVLEHSGHVVTRDKDKEKVFSAISNFIDENIPPSS